MAVETPVVVPRQARKRKEERSGGGVRHWLRKNILMQ